MARYPDILKNPDGDPRIYQQQYEDWYREQKEYEQDNWHENSEPDDSFLIDR